MKLFTCFVFFALVGVALAIIDKPENDSQETSTYTKLPSLDELEEIIYKLTIDDMEAQRRTLELSPARWFRLVYEAIRRNVAPFMSKIRTLPRRPGPNRRKPPPPIKPPKPKHPPYRKRFPKQPVKKGSRNM